MSTFEAKVSALDDGLLKLGRVAVAVSGGVDSSTLWHAAVRVLGEEAVGLIADSPSLPRRDLEDARDLATSLGSKLIELSTSELEDERYTKNDALRCYHCRRILFEGMGAWAAAHGYTALAYGEIADDAMDDRPGRRAASEHRVCAPLAESGFTKEDVRRYAREHGLEVAERPASACLASRIPRGTPVTERALGEVERAEQAIRELGFSVLRVRHQDEAARVEVGPDELARAQEMRPTVEEALAKVGFKIVDLATYVDPTQR